MDELQNKIQLSLIQEELSEGHESNFLLKLQRESISKRKPLYFIITLAAAASIAILISINIKTFTDYSIDSEFILCNENSEVAETEMYLKNEITIRLSSIDELKINSRQSNSIKKDIKEIDESLQKLKIDLKEAPGDQRIVEAIINTYFLKIETLDNIMTILKKYS